jgi:hypothetical protein
VIGFARGKSCVLETSLSSSSYLPGQSSSCCAATFTNGPVAHDTIEQASI